MQRVPGPEQKVAIITGGSRGLGAALVAGFLERGAAVASFSRMRTRFVDETLCARKDAFHWRALDGRDHACLQTFVKDVTKRFGRIDVLVNNAGIPVEGLLPMTRPETIVAAVETNLTTALVLAQACSRAMLRQGAGTIVNISSVNAIRGHAGVVTYSATKAALDGMTRSLARELGPRNIRVNSVAPGYFDSEMVAHLSDDQKQRIARRTPLGRLARIEEIANAVHFLVSDQASFITGQTLVVDGGITC